VDHSSIMTEPVAMISAEAKVEYNEACMACMTTSHMHTTMNHFEEVKYSSKEDTHE
jgi:hypothetical protein